MTDRILFIDDEPNVLNAITRQLRKKYTMTTAVGPEAGIETLKKDGPFAVIVSDMNMPGMSGAAFLAEGRRSR